MNRKIKTGLLSCLLGGIASPLVAQEVLPFPTTPSASTAGVNIAESVHKRRVEKSHLPAGAPNIIIVLIDDAGPALPTTVGGEVNTPNFSRIANQGIMYNTFNSTAMSSPTRASLLTGRNHTRVGNGQITELASDFDGFSGTIPKTSATVAEILKNYGYNTAAFGKWHNTPALHTTKVGPFEYWPMGYGFEYFYGFLAGEASQYEPTLIKNTTYVPLPKTAEEGYHLTEDIAENAIEWMQNQKAINPDKPFFMYWAPGAVHGPHQVAKEWADKYKGKFDDGWDKYRERAFAKQKELGWIPLNTKLTPRDKTMPAWTDLSKDELAFQSRLMEVFAGFGEHTDYNVGRILDAVEQLGEMDNTLIFYIWGDNGSSAEGQGGTISELIAQNQIPSKIEDQIATMNELGGLDVLGTPKTDNMYHAGWAWAGSTPFKGTKLMASYFGGIRQPLAVSWPKNIKPDKTIRTQFHHVNDIAPTIYEVVGITPPNVVNGFPQDPIDGVSMLYSMKDAKAEGQKKTQFFDVMGSRGIYHDGWFAGTRGPRIPWLTYTPGIESWTPENDVWELYNLEEDYSQANDLAKSNPEKVQQMKDLFLVESTKNKNLPIGGGLYINYHPEDILKPAATEFNFPGSLTRLPEFAAPRIGSFANTMIVDCEIPNKAEGVLFALGAFSAGVTSYIKDGYLHYEYNCFEVTRSKIKSSSKLPVGKAKIEYKMTTSPSPLRPGLLQGTMNILVNGKNVGSVDIPALISFAFTANECFDVGCDLGSPVAEEYFHKAPYRFNGKINNVNIKYN